MTARRLQKDLKELQERNMKCILDLDASDLYSWKVTVVPDFEPYKGGAFRMVINFPDNYPFQKPKIKFITKIYHPNVADFTGYVDMALTCPSTGAWSPAVTVAKLMEALITTLKEPDYNHTLRPELYYEYKKDSATPTYFKKAAEFTRKFACLPDPEFSEREGKCTGENLPSCNSSRDDERKLKDEAKLLEQDLHLVEGKCLPFDCQ